MALDLTESVLTLSLAEPRRTQLEDKLRALGFESYQQFADACASLLVGEHPPFVLAVLQACHLDGNAPQMSWTEPGKDDEDL
jgi:hypothetical protein